MPLAAALRKLEPPPDSALVAAAYRPLILAALPALARGEGAPPRSLAAVRTALWTTALGRVPAEERAYADLIETHRARLAERDDSGRAVRWMSLPPILVTILMRIVRELGPRSCLELGTGFGLSTAHQAAALELNGAGRLMSLDIEGMVELAEPGLDDLGLGERVELVGGLIEETLPGACEDAAPVEYVLLDADHREESTLAQLEVILPAVAPGAVIVVDDVNWEDGQMPRVWRAIAAHERVAASTQLYRLGIAIVDEGAEPVR